MKVGTGGSAFWIDRCEASVCANPDGTGMQYGVASDDYPASFPPNGQWSGTTPPVYALSRALANSKPSAYITWFQALEACAASGERMPTGEEWLTAARASSLADRAHRMPHRRVRSQ